MLGKTGVIIISRLTLVPIPFISGCNGVQPANLGVKEGRSAACPSSPNCVSSQSPDRGHYVEPLSYSSSTPDAMAALKNIILQKERTKIVTETSTYLHVEFTSAIWRFVDDVEFMFDEDAKLIHMRPASRRGHSDFGVSRKRIGDIRKFWAASGR
jgi:uncharacterized protein (DUF1499 family)